jgi:hypothetical protein
MHVLFVEPAFPRNQREFVRGLANVGARVTGIGERPFGALDDQLKKWLHGYEQVPSVVHEPSLQDAVRRIQAREWVDRLEATVEAHILPAANVRRACTIPGTTPETAFLCRDKPAMKEALRKADVPCAQSTAVSSHDEALRFAKAVGYPLIVKPRAGAGASGTTRVDDDGALRRALDAAHVGPRGSGASVALEEFVEGHEAFYDTMCIDGRPTQEFITHYYPGVLEAMRTRWISPVFVTTNRIDAPGYDEVRKLGRRVIEVLGIGTSPTHMEWFFGPKGLKFSEIGCRPPGVGAWDLYCAGNDMDLYREWAHSIVHGRPEQRPSRRFAAGIINLRPSQDGRIKHYLGLDEFRSRFGDRIIDFHFPPPGTPTMPVESGYMANAWIRLKHPDYDELRNMLRIVGETVKVVAE